MLPNYSIEHTPTDVLARGALLYINNRLSYKPRADLKIVYPWQVRISILIAYINIQCFILVILIAIMFLLYYAKPSKESSKQILLLGDFNTDLLKYESSELVNSFLGILPSNFLSPQKILPTQKFFLVYSNR